MDLKKLASVRTCVPLGYQPTRSIRISILAPRMQTMQVSQADKPTMSSSTRTALLFSMSHSEIVRPGQAQTRKNTPSGGNVSASVHASCTMLPQAHPSQPYLVSEHGIRNGHCVTPTWGCLVHDFGRPTASMAGHNIEVLVTPQLQSLLPSVMAGQAADVTRAAR